jgi:hypothetical protein
MPSSFQSIAGFWNRKSAETDQLMIDTEKNTSREKERPAKSRYSNYKAGNSFISAD